MGVHVRFADIDQQGPARPAAAPVLSGPPTGRKLGKQKSQGFKGQGGCEQGIAQEESNILGH
eukprot:1669316-Alexandrium_andersonii.AAC.1